MLFYQAKNRKKIKNRLTKQFFFGILTQQFNFLAGKGQVMKVRCSLKSAKTRDKNCKVVRRKGRVYVINKLKPKLKAKQG